MLIFIAMLELEYHDYQIATLDNTLQYKAKPLPTT